MKRIRPSTGTKWWPILGYSQAMVQGRLVRVSATAAAEIRKRVIEEDGPCAQAEDALRNLTAALGALGAGLEHVFRTRVYVKDLGHWPLMAQAYAKVFAEFDPENSIVEAPRFKSRESLVEIEADALVPHDWLRVRGADPWWQSTLAQDRE